MNTELDIVARLRAERQFYAASSTLMDEAAELILLLRKERAAKKAADDGAVRCILAGLRQAVTALYLACAGIAALLVQALVR